MGIMISPLQRLNHCYAAKKSPKSVIRREFWSCEQLLRRGRTSYGTRANGHRSHAKEGTNPRTRVSSHFDDRDFVGSRRFFCEHDSVPGR